jgi:hypothetical protein
MASVAVGFKTVFQSDAVEIVRAASATRSETIEAVVMAQCFCG